MTQLSEEVYEAEKKRLKRYREILELPVVIFLFVGIITVVFNVTFGGFTPLFWFLLSYGGCSHDNLYGDNDDTIRLGTQEIELRNVIRRVWETTCWQYSVQILC